MIRGRIRVNLWRFENLMQNLQHDQSSLNTVKETISEKSLAISSLYVSLQEPLGGLSKCMSPKSFDLMEVALDSTSSFLVPSLKFMTIALFIN